MGDQVTKDGASDTPETDDAANIEQPGTSQGQRSADDLEERLARRFEMALEKNRRETQSMVDKQIAALKKQAQPNMLDRFQQLTKEGYTEREARLQIDLEELKGQSTASDPVQGRTAASEPPAQSSEAIDYASIITEAELDANQPQVIELMQAGHKSAAEARAAAFQLKLKLLKTPPPSPSATPVATGGENKPRGENPKIARLAELMKYPTLNRTEILRLRQELNAEGWK